MTARPTKPGNDQGQHFDAIQRNNKRLVESAVRLGIDEYAASCRARVDAFIDKHFGFGGAWNLNKNGIGLDLLRAPANLVWAPIRFVARGAASVAGKAGLDRIAALGHRVPMGFKTDVERELEWLIFSELLELPYRDDDRTHSSEKNTLVECIVRQKPMRDAWRNALNAVGDLTHNRQRQAELHEELSKLLDNRKDVAELTTAIVATSAGLVAHKSLNLGALGLGQATAVAISQSLAVSGFIFGPTLGGVFYAALPGLAAPSFALVVGVTAGVAALMGTLAAIAGVLSDPAQRALGMHKKKLHSLIDVVEQRLRGQAKSEQAFREGLIARLFDVIDVVYTVGRKIT